MGCIQSRRDVNEGAPNEFCVVNIDECGNGLWAGRLEVADAELVLHRRGKETTRWPLRSLRRYGFDGEIFSFESGRRCATGEGIYAFKCRRAEQLFNALQRCIQIRNHNNESVLESLANEAPSRPPGAAPRPPPEPLRLVAVHDRSEYAEPARPAPFRTGSAGSGPLSPEVRSPGSPSSANILEVMPLAPLPNAGAQVTNLYQFQDFPLQREHNNNRKSKFDPSDHSYSNTGDINTDLATLRHSFQTRQFSLPDDEDFDDFDDGGVPADDGAPASPALSASGEHYATLAVRNAGNGRAGSRVYMNFNAGDAGVLPAIREEAGARFGPHGFRTPADVQAQKSTNFNFTDIMRSEMEEEIHNYANLGSGEINYDPRLLNCQPGVVQRANAVEIDGPFDAQAEAVVKINYAVLDLDKAGDETAEDNGQALPPSSPKKPAMGYTVIDFNKTEALTSVALGTEVDTEGSRKTRHNSTALPPSPTVT